MLASQVAFQASHDPLTGLANRVVLTDRMERDYAQPSTACALLMMDLDGFKLINDTYGHPVGDELLRNVADRLRAATPENATVARLGGDEFAILIEDTEPAAAMVLANGIVDALREIFMVAGHNLGVTTSIGVVRIAEADPPTPAKAFRNADSALYAAKAAGKNRAIQL